MSQQPVVCQPVWDAEGTLFVLQDQQAMQNQQLQTQLQMAYSQHRLELIEALVTPCTIAFVAVLLVAALIYLVRYAINADMKNHADDNQADIEMTRIAGRRVEKESKSDSD